MGFCQHCQKDWGESRFCGTCGGPLAPPAPATAPPAPAPKAMTLPQPPAARLHPYLLAAMICAALVFFTIPVIAAILAPRFVAKRAQDQFGVCSDNLKKTIVVALEMYGADHNQRFPLELSALLPTYVKKIPTCPAAEIDTYSKGYRVTGEGDGYVVMCLGHNHGGANLEPDFPQYSSSEGFRK